MTILSTSIWSAMNYTNGDVRCWTLDVPVGRVEALKIAQTLVQVPQGAKMDSKASEALTELLNAMLELISDGRFDNLANQD
jgi:hypothetical protein